MVNWSWLSHDSESYKYFFLKLDWISDSFTRAKNILKALKFIYLFNFFWKNGVHINCIKNHQTSKQSSCLLIVNKYILILQIHYLTHSSISMDAMQNKTLHLIAPIDQFEGENGPNEVRKPASFHLLPLMIWKKHAIRSSRYECIPGLCCNHIITATTLAVTTFHISSTQSTGDSGHKTSHMPEVVESWPF